MKLELYNLIITDKDGGFDKGSLVLFKSKEDLTKYEISSIYVGEGFKVVVYSDINYTGSEKLFPAGRHDYVGIDWDSKIMSIKLLKKDDPYTSPEEKTLVLEKELEKQKFKEQMTPILYGLIGGGILILLFFLYLKNQMNRRISVQQISTPLVGGFKKIFKKFKKLF